MRAPSIAPVPGGVHRPLWSVMIPTYNSACFLNETLKSVLGQDPGPDQMEIWVVDDASKNDDLESVVRTVAGNRVKFWRNPENLGATRNFNRCIELSKGHLVHILHGDDFVCSKFYELIGELSELHQCCSFLATRVFVVDEDGIILGVSPRLEQMERPTHQVTHMLQAQYFQTPGIVVRRAFYEQFGGFAPELVHCADWEMWVRAVCNGGGIVHPQPLASYRMFSANNSRQLARSGENIRDLLRLQSFFSRYPGFSEAALRAMAAEWALDQHRRFLAEGDAEAAMANANLYAQLVPFSHRLARQAIAGARKVVYGVL